MSQKLIPDHQFGFKLHSSIEQVHIVYNNIRNTIEIKQYCTAEFLDITQAFDKVWHLSPLHKLKLNLPYNYYVLLRSYLTKRAFIIRIEHET